MYVCMYIPYSCDLFLSIRFSYKYGGSLVSFTRPLSSLWSMRGKQQGRIACHRLMRLAMKLVVAQFSRAKDHEIINEGIECLWSENAMQFLHHHQLATNLQPCSQSHGRCIASQ